MMRARCVGGPLDGKEKVSEYECWPFVQCEPMPVDKYWEMVKKHPNGNVASVWAVTHVYQFRGTGHRQGVWDYVGTQP